VGIHEDRLWNMTWNEYHRACSFFHHSQELEWERTRWLGALIFNANSKKSKTPQQLVPLQLDKKRKKNTLLTTPDDVTRILEAAQKRKQQQNGKQ
jgi:hypothetical protein